MWDGKFKTDKKRYIQRRNNYEEIYDKEKEKTFHTCRIHESGEYIVSIILFFFHFPAFKSKAIKAQRYKK
ncbi:MAG: hypothetical protein JETT_3579 [Candidatus Jettenia ecosi]|uniref:Uncharacterized protein n=1 Tax=Candidatus Jettenia ecosi TaxID=2494326 RepID=A0A533Q6E3_9BACT|nr:MAG: hypothetical protein JETT_3579 [Candidatus Jettenia ecosi]